MRLVEPPLVLRYPKKKLEGLRTGIERNRMISDYQIQSVIKAYMENMKTRVVADREKGEETGVKDMVTISQESIRIHFVEKVQSHVTRRIVKSDLLRIEEGVSEETNHE